MQKIKTVLVVAAHPDDEILGCGGTIARFVQDKTDVFVLILAEGVTGRDEKRNREARSNEIADLRKESIKANKFLGVKKVVFYNYPDNRFDTVPLLNLVKTIEQVKRELKPDVVFTHYEKDLNIDHQVVYRAVLTATRPVKTEIVKELYSFEVLSSTEWAYPLSFSADTFIDISKFIEKKARALKFYRSEINSFPHPRSEEGIKVNAQYWGMKSGMHYAEAFKTIRRIK